MPDQSDHQHLLNRLAQGDRTALEHLLFDYHDRLLHHIREKLPSSLQTIVGAEDILQQTYVAAFRGLGQFEPRSDRAFYRWLTKIAENQVLDAIKAQGRKKRGGDFRRVGQPKPQQDTSMANLLEELSDGGRSPSTIAARAEGVRALQVAMAGLKGD